MTTKFISAQQEKVSEPLPLEKPEENKKEAYRIWIGNVDPELNEYTLLQVLKKYGKIKEFDYLFHKSGVLQGKSRGFHFATYFAKKDAERAIKYLNGKYLMSKTLLVRWADEHEKAIPVNLNLKTDLVKNEVEIGPKSKKISKSSMISSIEQKLKEMERQASGQPSTSGALHPLLQKAKANAVAEEARKRTQPYRKPFKRKR